MKTLYYLSYNNYYNRLLKREETIEDYLAKAELCGEIANVNFYPNDGVLTTQTAYLNALNNTPNYLVVAEESTGEIVSRWFVVECQYNTGKTQYILSLYRDLIAEWWPQIVEQPFFCEKGSLSVFDNGIFNDEAITTSQIKKEEHQLKDGSGIPWIVGYYASPLERDLGGALKDTDKTYIYNTTKITPDITVEDINSWEYKGAMLKMVDDWNVAIYYYQTPLLGSNTAWFVPYRPGQSGIPYKADVMYGNWKTTVSPTRIVGDLARIAGDGDNPTLLKNAFTSHTGYSFDESLRRTWLNLDGKKILDEATGTLYEIVVNRTQRNEENKPISIGDQLGQMINNQALQASVLDGGYIWTGQPNANNQRYSCTHSEYTVRLIAVTTDEGSFTIKKTRRQLYDAPYCMFCIPYGKHPIRVNAQITTASSATESLNIASALATQSGGWLYDVQLLPYCPIPELRYSTVEDLPMIGFEMVADQDYTMVYGSNDNITGIIYWAQFSKGSFTIDSPTSFTLPDNPFIFKSKCQTEFMRLCSPNYNGVFEFSPYKNRGLDYFVVDYTYKPFQPYIRIAPNFGGLYGQEFGDARGLILGGDFSLAQLDDAWRSYELENKNYQGMFNRQVENMEVQHKYQRVQDIANTITGTVGGSATGAMAGSNAGPYGAIAGGIIGGVSSLVGGIADWKINEALRGEALDYTKDLFGYQLDNIKALPYTLTRVSAFNINNKLFPFLEVYGTTQEEYNAVYNKIKYNGMTVERIGTISVFSLPIDDGDNNLIYVKGQLVRFPEAIAEDFHTVNTLGIELNKGVYVK